MRHVDLCSGIGGFSLGFEWAGLSKPVLFCDVEPWCRRVLSKHWPDVPVASDVKELANDPDRNVPDCDILTAGYPCQPFSLAGERRGTEDDRHIWPYILSIVKAKRPAWCVFENVYGHVSMGLDEVLSDLEGEGYAARPFIVPACAADAPHRRDRVWIIARNVGDTSRLHSDGSGEHSQQSERQEPKSRNGGSSDDVADSNSAGLQGRQNARDTSQSRAQRDKQSARRSQRPDGQNWKPEPAVGRVANGIPRRVDRLKGLGNAIVPQIAMRIGQTIKAVADQ
jgi:DNA (cytosine-5)-methyltransferase 1